MLTRIIAVMRSIITLVNANRPFKYTDAERPIYVYSRTFCVVYRARINPVSIFYSWLLLQSRHNVSNWSCPLRLSTCNEDGLLVDAFQQLCTYLRITSITLSVAIHQFHRNFSQKRRRQQNIWPSTSRTNADSSVRYRWQETHLAVQFFHIIQT